MKIESKANSNKISIIAPPLFLKGLHKGMQLPARIIERSGNKEAVLEIQGKKINASFQKGIPGNNQLLLKLEDIRNNSYIFKLVNITDKNDFLHKIIELTMFSKDKIPDNIHFDLHKLLQNNTIGLFQLNAFLFNKLFNTQKEHNKGISAFLNTLLAQGLSLQDGHFLAYMLSGSKIDPQLYALLSLFTKKQKQVDLDENKIEDIINKICRFVDNSIIKEDLIKLLTSFLIVDSNELQTGHMGELPLFDEESFKPVNYLASDKAWMFSLDFSHIGAVDIIIKKDITYATTIFVENDEIKTAFEASIEKLFVQLKDIVGYIHIYVREKVINKMIEINTYYATNSTIDIKI